MPKWTTEQKEAIEKKGENILVSAGAGSGKTAVLTTRVLEKLKRGTHIDSLLILTFTNAAASEMKERIRLKIKEVPSLKKELDRIDTAYITTFDSFALSIVRKYHYKLNLEKEVQIASSAFLEDRKRKILQEIFDAYYEEENEAFFRLLSTFTSKDDKTLQESILVLYNKMERELDKEKYSKQYDKKFYSASFFHKLNQDFQNLLQEKRKEIEEEIEKLSLEVRGDYIEKLKEVVTMILESATVNRLPTLPKESSEKAKKRKEILKKKIDIYLNLAEKTTKERVEDYKKTQETITMLLEIMTKLDKEMMAFKYQHNVFSFLDIEKMALNLILENQALLFELKSKFKEIMIDEYQDTNDLQEQFISLFANNNCYMVGDIKQSIYRFRNANPSIFKEKYERFAKGEAGYKIDMNKNFRSREEVIQDINLLFSSLMDSELGGADYALSHQMVFGNLDYQKYHAKQNYHMEFLTYDLQEEKKDLLEIKIIAQDILKKVKEQFLIYDASKKELRPVTFSDFAILLDRTTNSSEYKKIFESYQIPLTILKDVTISNQDLLLLIANILHFLFAVLHKKDYRFYFTSIARSFLYEYSDEEIFDCVTKKTMNETEIYQNILLLKEKYLLATPSMLMDALFTIFEIEEKLYKVGDSKENTKLMDSVYALSLELENIGYTTEDLDQFIEAIVNRGLDLKVSAPKKGGNSVALMTIHKSKGLEFPICYFAGLTKRFNISDLNEPFLYSREYGMICPYFTEGLNDTFVKEIVKEKYKREEVSEKLRLFYVALTRVREKMVFVCPSFSEEKEVNRFEARSFYDFLCTLSKKLEPYIIKACLEEMVVEESREEEVEKQVLLVEEYPIQEETFKKQTFSKKKLSLFSEEEKKQLSLGREIHTYFEETDFFNITPSKYEKYLRAFLQQEVVKGIENAKIIKEYEFVYEEEKRYHGIIDLLLVYDNEIILIDYKLKEIEDASYQKQLKGYQRYIERKTNKKVRIYLYSILQDKMKKID